MKDAQFIRSCERWILSFALSNYSALLNMSNLSTSPVCLDLRFLTLMRKPCTGAMLPYLHIRLCLQRCHLEFASWLAASSAVFLDLRISEVSSEICFLRCCLLFCSCFRNLGYFCQGALCRFWGDFALRFPSRCSWTSWDCYLGYALRSGAQFLRKGGDRFLIFINSSL